MPTLDDGRNAINQGNFQQARLIFEAILQENPRSEEAWLGLADVLTDTEDKRICYENVLKINKQNRVAREGLRSLEPEEDQLRKAFGLQQTATPREEMADEEEDDAATIGAPLDTESAEAGETPTMILVAVGLALSVVVMAAGGGLVFYIITNLTGG